MENDFYRFVESRLKEHTIAEKYIRIMVEFFGKYGDTVDKTTTSEQKVKETFLTFVDMLDEEKKHPTHFEPYHHRVKQPFDYYAYGLDFFRPLIRNEYSQCLGKENIQNIVEKLKRRENVILFANHQIEGDPQVLSLILEKEFPNLGEEMIFVAGDRVISDPLAIPFSKGRNLFCIYSKKYINYPPEKKTEKLMHNKRTMQRMREKLEEGGKCIYVAPSGGRDRPNEEGIYQVAPFDAQSIEMFYLMAKRSNMPTSFHTLALLTYALLPPPETIQLDLGEVRVPRRVGIYAYFGPQADMEHFPGCDATDKMLQRQARADSLWKKTCSMYEKLKEIAPDYED